MYIDPNTGGILFHALAAAFGVVSILILSFSVVYDSFLPEWGEESATTRSRIRNK